MAHDPWRMGFHLTPPTGWLNDPNGLCQIGGTYHVFHQYSPDWPKPDAPRGWGHFWSHDLVHWQDGGRNFAIAPDTPDEASGAYSGCAVPFAGGMRLYYTGNVKETGNYDYVHDGRRSVQMLIESPDGHRMGEKHALLRNDDYPAFCTRHVRDPKVWREDGTWWMILGARDQDDRGLALKYCSGDGLIWNYAGCVRTKQSLGFMWECPDRIALSGNELLSICPQGMEGESWSHGIRDVAGYLPLSPHEALASEGDLVLDAARFRLWDQGFDFYAPQSFVDSSGRTILIAWMGLPAAPWESAPNDMTWCHCLTAPRELALGQNGTLLQLPVAELDALRGVRHALPANGAITMDGHSADVVCEACASDGMLALDGALELSWSNGTVRISFVDDAVGCGRSERSASCGSVRKLRVLIDSSAIEVFVNEGEATFSTRWFPRSPSLTIVERGPSLFHVWEMGDGMTDTYE